MIAKNVSARVLVSAAQKIGVAIDVHPLNQKGDRFRVKVNSQTTVDNYRDAKSKDGDTYRVRYSDERGDAPYQREAVGYGSAGRRVHAVCWHGFRDFFRAVFVDSPDAVFQTGLDTWKGSADFEARFASSGYKNIGSPIAPVAMVYACRCSGRGRI
jgi:hypothetical protein